MQRAELKRLLLSLLDEDEEFRHAVAAKLGLLEIIKRLDQMYAEMQKIWAELRRVNERLEKGQERILERLFRVERTLEKLTVDVEEEARSVVEHRLRERGLDVRVGRFSSQFVELDIYGASGDLCVLGEATVRAGLGALDRLLGAVESMKKLHPDALRRRAILVIYSCLPTPELVERARELGVWILKATEEFTEPRELEL